MKWQKNHPKRLRQFRRQKKTIVVIGLSMTGLLLISGGIYFFAVFTTPLYISPLPLLKAVQGIEDTSLDQQISTELKKRHILYTNIDTRESSAIIVKLKDNGEVLLTGDKKISLQIASLQVILVRLTMEGKQFRTLDLRFGKPVIAFKDKKIMLDEVQQPTVASSSGEPVLDTTASPSVSDNE